MQGDAQRLPKDEMSSGISSLPLPDEDLEPSQEEVEEYAQYLEIDLETEQHLMWIAREGVVAPVPPPWKEYEDAEKNVFYFNLETAASVWDHPCDAKYKAMVEEYRAKGQSASSPPSETLWNRRQTLKAEPKLSDDVLNSVPELSLENPPEVSEEESFSSDFDEQEVRDEAAVVKFLREEKATADEPDECELSLQSMASAKSAASRRSEKSDRSKQSEKSDRSKRSEKSASSRTSERSERSEASRKSEMSQASGKSERSERSDVSRRRKTAVSSKAERRDSYSSDRSSARSRSFSPVRTPTRRRSRSGSSGSSVSSRTASPRTRSAEPSSSKRRTSKVADMERLVPITNEISEEEDMSVPSAPSSPDSGRIGPSPVGALAALKDSGGVAKLSEDANADAQEDSTSSTRKVASLESMLSKSQGLTLDIKRRGLEPLSAPTKGVLPKLDVKLGSVGKIDADLKLAVNAHRAKTEPEVTCADDLSLKLPSGPRVCIMGGTSFQNEHSEELTEALAQEFNSFLPAQTLFITEGMQGVQATFAARCDSKKLVNLVPSGEDSGYNKGKDVRAGANLVECGHIFSECGDVYVTIEGGEALADIAKRIAKRPLVDIVPIIRSGGASSGEFGFPLPSRPKGVSESLWDRLADSRLPVGDTARAAAEIVYASLIETHSLDETEVTDIKVHGKLLGKETLDDDVQDIEERDRLDVRPKDLSFKPSDGHDVRKGLRESEMPTTTSEHNPFSVEERGVPAAELDQEPKELSLKPRSFSYEASNGLHRSELLKNTSLHNSFEEERGVSAAELEQEPKELSLQPRSFSYEAPKGLHESELLKNTSLHNSFEDFPSETEDVSHTDRRSNLGDTLDLSVTLEDNGAVAAVPGAMTHAAGGEPSSRVVGGPHWRRIEAKIATLNRILPKLRSIREKQKECLLLMQNGP